MKLKPSLVLIGWGVVSAWTTQAAIIANWTFETSQPTTTGPINPEVGSGVASAFGVGGLNSPIGNGLAHSYSGNAWAVGDYWQFQVSTIGFSGITIQWDQAGSGTGPRDFALQYSLDGTAFVLVNTYQVPLSTWSSSSTQSGFIFYSTFTPTIASAIEDQATLYFRLVNSSNSSINGSTVGSAGTDRVDNFLVQATAVPESSTFIAGALLLLPFGARGVRYLRNRKLSKAVYFQLGRVGLDWREQVQL